MHKLYLILFSLLFTINTTDNDCDLAYTNATYALSHAKKAFKANNFDHQKFYSEKVLDSYQKITKYLENCDCGDLPEKVRDAMDAVENAADPVDWDRGRYYSKKTYNSTIDLITALDMLSSSETVTE